MRCEACDRKRALSELTTLKLGQRHPFVCKNAAQCQRTILIEKLGPGPPAPIPGQITVDEAIQTVQSGEI